MQFPSCRCLASEDAVARRHAALALRDVAKLSQGCAQAMADSGCLSALVAALGPGEQMYVRQRQATCVLTTPAYQYSSPSSLTLG